MKHTRIQSVKARLGALKKQIDLGAANVPELLEKLQELEIELHEIQLLKETIDYLPEVVIAKNLPKFTPESIAKEFGYRDSKQAGKEVKRKSYIGTKRDINPSFIDKNGMSIDAAAENLKQLFPYNNKIDEFDIKNIIIDILFSGSKSEYLKKFDYESEIKDLEREIASYKRKITAASPEHKEPYKLTWNEYANSHYQNIKDIVVQQFNQAAYEKFKDKPKSKVGFENFKGEWWHKNNPHKLLVMQAIKEGKKVPKKILNQYKLKQSTLNGLNGMADKTKVYGKGKTPIWSIDSEGNYFVVKMAGNNEFIGDVKYVSDKEYKINYANGKWVIDSNGAFIGAPIILDYNVLRFVIPTMPKGMTDAGWTGIRIDKPMVNSSTGQQVIGNDIVAPTTTTTTTTPATTEKPSSYGSGNNNMLLYGGGALLAAGLLLSRKKKGGLMGLLGLASPKKRKKKTNGVRIKLPNGQIANIRIEKY